MSHAKFLTIKAPAKSSTGGSSGSGSMGSMGTGSTGGSGSGGSGSTGGTSSGGGTGSGTMDPAWTAATHVTSLPRPLRRAVIFGGPLLAYLIGIAHPSQLVVGESERLFLAIHLAFPFVICLLAWTLVLLVDGIDDRAADPRARPRDPVRRRLHRDRVGRRDRARRVVWKAEGLSGDSCRTRRS